MTSVWAGEDEGVLVELKALWFVVVELFPCLLMFVECFPTGVEWFPTLSVLVEPSPVLLRLLLGDLGFTWVDAAFWLRSTTSDTSLPRLPGVETGHGRAPLNCLRERMSKDN